MDPTLTWLLLIAAAVLIIAGAMRFDLLATRWHDAFSAPPPPHDAPPAPRWTTARDFTAHQAPVRKPAFHRSGRRH